MLAPIVLALAPVQEPVPQILARDGAALPGGAPGTTIEFVREPRSTAQGGFTTFISTRDGSGAWRRGMWGSFDRSAASLLPIANGANGSPLVLERGFTAAAGDLVYQAITPGFGRALMRANQVLVHVNLQGAFGGRTIHYIDDVRATSTGEILAAMRVEDGAGVREGFYLGDTLALLIEEGGALQGAGGAETIDRLRERHVHPRATGYAAIAHTTSGRAIVMVDGAAHSVGGVVVERGALVDPGGPGALTWAELRDVAADGQGSVWISGRLSNQQPGAFALVRDGEVLMRTGDVVDGRTIVTLRGLHVGADGTPLSAWSVPGSQIEFTLFAGRRAILRSGDGLDVDGDGVADPGWALAGLPFTSQAWSYLDLDEDNRLLALGSIGVGSFAILQLVLELGEEVCAGQPNSTGAAAELELLGTGVAAANSLGLRGSGMPANAFFLGLASRDPGFVPMVGGSQGDLCLGGSIGRFRPPFASTSITGEVSLVLDLQQLAQPQGPVQAMPGETWHFQLWFRDSVGGTSSSNLSEARSILLR